MSLELSPEAHARLNDKKWRRSQSKWMLWIYITSSMLGVVGFARLAIKTKDKTLRKYAYIFSGLLFVVFLLIGLDDSTTTKVDGQDVTESGTLGTIGGIMLIVNYGLQIFFSFKANKIWLVFRAQNNNPTWTAENLNVTDVARKAFTAPQELVKDALGIERSDFYATEVSESTEKITPPPPPPSAAQKKMPPPPPVSSGKTDIRETQTIDLNLATVEILMRSADFDPVLAANTIVQREKRGGFSSFEEFANDLKLQPHQVAKLKPILIVQKQAETGGSSGRILDI
jgi:DNA uptake protein ComE-like DNA-binding protein